MPNDCPDEVHYSKCWQCGWRTFKCSRCQGCYQCEHTALYEDGKWVWLCKDGKKRPFICEICGCQPDEREKQQKAFLNTFLRTPPAPQQSWPF